MSRKRLAAQRRDGRCSSLGKIEQPVATATVSLVAPEIHRFTCLLLCQYRRAEEAPVPARQYSIPLSSSSSRVSTFSRWPSQSVHDQNFSTIQAHRAAGESTSPYPSVCGRVDCSAEYPEPHSLASSSDSSAARSSPVRSSKVAGSGAAIGGVRWIPTRCSGPCCPMLVVMLVPQSPPWAPKRW